MTDQLERMLLDSLNGRAHGPVDTSALVTVAARRGRRRQLRNYAAAAVGVLALVVLTGVAVARPATAPVGGPPVPTGSPSRPPSHVPGLPVASGVPGAAADPGLVGTDPSTMHFTVDDWTVASDSTTWSTADGSESIQFSNGGYYEVDLTRSATQLDTLMKGNHSAGEDWPAETSHQDVSVGGRAARFTAYGTGGGAPFTLRWQPFDGVSAQVYGHGSTKPAADSAAIAVKIRFTTAYRCATPVRVTTPPTGAKVLSCSIAMTGNDIPDPSGNVVRLAESTLTVGTGADHAVIQFTRALGSGPEPSQPTVSIAGHPARRTVNEAGRLAIVIPNFDGVDIELDAYGTYGYNTLTAIGNGIKVSADLSDPTTWPDRLIG